MTENPIGDAIARTRAALLRLTDQPEVLLDDQELRRIRALLQLAIDALNQTIPAEITPCAQ